MDLYWCGFDKWMHAGIILKKEHGSWEWYGKSMGIPSTQNPLKRHATYWFYTCCNPYWAVPCVKLLLLTKVNWQPIAHNNLWKSLSKFWNWGLIFAWSLSRRLFYLKIRSTSDHSLDVGIFVVSLFCSAL